jgi:hypothetical protein
MAKRGFVMTYEIVTPESAEYGDAEERGYTWPGGNLIPLDRVTDESEYFNAVSSTHEMADELLRAGADDRDYGPGLFVARHDQDYRTGEQQTDYYNLIGWTPYQIQKIRSMVHGGSSRAPVVYGGRR